MAHAFFSASARSPDPKGPIYLKRAEVVGNRVVVGTRLSGFVEFHISDVTITSKGHVLKRGAVALRVLPAKIAGRFGLIRPNRGRKTDVPCRCVGGCKIECATGRAIGTCTGTWSECGRAQQM